MSLAVTEGASEVEAGGIGVDLRWMLVTGEEKENWRR